MYLDHFHLNKSPFPEKPDPTVFFPQAERENILQSLLVDISAHKSLIKLIGAEGSGKTLLCNLLISNIINDYDVVYLENPLGSFDDVLRIICIDLGMDPTGDSHENITLELNKQLSIRKAEKRSVVIVVDEAEKLFLATLERLIKVLCDNEAEGVLQILLTGRPGLNSNLNQLTVYCSNVDIHAGYFLEPLSLEETADYLKYRLKVAGLDEKEQDDIFTEGAVSKIFESAKGNLRLTNILAEESLQNSCSEKSFLVLLEHVDSKSDEHEVRRKQAPRVKKAIPRKIINKVQSSNLVDNNKVKEFFFKYKRQLGGCFSVLVAVVFIMILGGDHEPSEETESLSGKNTSQFEYVEEQAKEKLQQLPPVVNMEPVVETKPEPVRPTISMKKEESPPIFPQDFSDKESVEAVSRDAETIYRERLRSSASWLAGAYRGGTTIQLMKLTSQQGEGNLKKILVKDDYYSIKDELYILKKKTSPPTLFVFYGTFNTLDDARNYRNNMPVFLRKHHPYALSISDALRKIED